MTLNQTLKLLTVIIFSACISYTSIKILGVLMLSVLHLLVNYGTMLDVMLLITSLLAVVYILLYTLVKTIQNI